MLLAASAAEPTLATLEAASPGFADDLRPAIENDLVAIDRDAVRFGHPLFAQGVATLASPAELRAAHQALAAATPSPDARARHLAQATDSPDASVAAALADAARDARLRGATLAAASLYQDASRLTPVDDREGRLRLAQLAAECLFIDLSEYLEADRILAAAIAEGPAGPARADALSLRAIIRYYHGRVPEAIALGEQGLAEAGDADAHLRGVVLGRLGVPRDAARPRARDRARRRGGGAAGWRHEPRRGRSATPSRTRCCSARTPSSGSYGRRGPPTSSAASVSSRRTAGRGRRKAPRAAPSASPGTRTTSTGRSRSPAR